MKADLKNLINVKNGIEDVLNDYYHVDKHSISALEIKNIIIKLELQVRYIKGALYELRKELQS